MQSVKSHISMTGTRTLGADGKDYRANFVHAPFSEQISTPSAFTLEARGFPACGESPVARPQEVFHDRHQ